MKNIFEILSDAGITVDQDKQAGISKAVAENYKTAAEFEKKFNRFSEELNAQRKRAEAAEESLKSFEGTDYESIKAERDAWKRKHQESEAAHKRQQEQMEFSQLLERAILAEQGKNTRAIAALLDLDAIKASQDRDSAVKQALAKLKKEESYLFSDQTPPPYARGTGARSTGNTEASTGLAGALREKFERK